MQEHACIKTAYAVTYRVYIYKDIMLSFGLSHWFCFILGKTKWVELILI